MEESTPVLIGAGQFTEKGVSPELAHSPMGIAAEAAKAALLDAGCSGDLASAIDTVAVVRIFPDSYKNPRVPNPFGRAENPPRAVARRIGANPERAIYGQVGGNTPQKLISEMAERISEGEVGVVLLTGSEAINTAQLARRSSIELDWLEQDVGTLEDRGLGEPLSTKHEQDHGIAAPIFAYPLFENAIRGNLGRTIDSHMLEMGKLFAPFSRVAANNPFSFYGTQRTAEELATVTTDNRFISFPYPKWMNARDSVNQGAAVIMTSVGRARELGVDPSKWVFLHGCGEASDKIMLTERINYHSSPAMKLNSRKAFEMAAKTIDDMDYIDIYSCFPSAVEIACDALGLATDDARGLTVTGGLPFFGGPGNNYSMHAVATMMPMLRSNPSKFGLVSTNGGRLTKHATGIYSATPTLGKWTRQDPASYQAVIQNDVSPDFTETPSGNSKVETYTVAYNREGPTSGIVIGRQENGIRFLANTVTDGDFLRKFSSRDQLQTTGTVKSINGRNLFMPN